MRLPFSRRLVKVAPVGPGHTIDRNDPNLGHGVDAERTPQHQKYLVLSEDERAKGFVRPVRTQYMHVGRPGPRFPLLDLTPEQQERFPHAGYVKYEKYGEEESAVGRYWKQSELDSIDKGCKSITTMSLPLAETYAAIPDFYGATYCASCRMHRPVGAQGEFVWIERDLPTDIRVGT